MKKTKLLSMFLAVTLIFTMFPVTVFAGDGAAAENFIKVTGRVLNVDSVRYTSDVAVGLYENYILMLDLKLSDATDAEGNPDNAIFKFYGSTPWSTKASEVKRDDGVNYDSGDGNSYENGCASTDWHTYGIYYNTEETANFYFEIMSDNMADIFVDNIYLFNKEDYDEANGDTDFANVKGVLTNLLTGTTEPLSCDDTSGWSTNNRWGQAHTHTVEAKSENATDEPTEVPLPFSDVKESNWYYDGVRYVYDNELMSGMTDTSFGPDITTSRAMVVTILWRIEGKPTVDNALHFDDVDEDSWYADAVAWAAQNEIVMGKSEKLFDPSSDITREQMAAILYRYANHKGIDVSAGDVDIDTFADADQLSTYAKDAMKWANANELIRGIGNNMLAPKDGTTRAQAASIFMRFVEGLK